MRLTLLAVALLASACMPSVRSVTTDKHAKEVNTALNRPVMDVSAGSLWAGSGSMFDDAKARQVGDLVTIVVSESATATRNLGTSESKDGSHTTSINAALGYGQALAAKNPLFNPSTALDISNKKSFTGSGSTNNSDTLTANVTAVVTKVYPNGNMVVVGRRQLTINQQPQELTFSGIVRPTDIAPDNTISSSKVAQVKISYGSGGELATVTHEGWFTRTLEQVWPF